MCTVSRRGTEALSTSGPSWANDALSHAPYPRFLLYGLHQLKRRLNLTAGNHPAMLVFGPRMQREPPRFTASRQTFIVSIVNYGLIRAGVGLGSISVICPLFRSQRETKFRMASLIGLFVRTIKSLFSSLFSSHFPRLLLAYLTNCLSPAPNSPPKCRFRARRSDERAAL